MEPLRIVKMIIEVYNKEESPLHQIVKKLIYKKILFLVSIFITLEVSSPETLIIATPEIPGPVDKAYIVIQ